MTYYIHVNQNVIKSNKKHGADNPVFRVQKGKYGRPRYAKAVDFDNAWTEARFIGDPVLPCGARVVMCTLEEPRLDGVAFHDLA